MRIHPEAAGDRPVLPGGRLPTERDSRSDSPCPASRAQDARALRRRHHYTHEGGTFLVQTPGSGAGDTTPPRVPHSPAELMEARLLLEPAMAELIVTHHPGRFRAHESRLDRAERASL